MLRSAVPRVLAGAAAAAAVLALAAADGGYFPTAWGWAALVPLLASGAALALRGQVGIERLDGLWLAALAAFAAWIGLSALWAVAVAEPLLELERALVYVAAAAALLLLGDRRTAPALAAGTLAGIAAVAAWGLANRLVPDRFGDFDSSGGYQLAEPIGYWNALGVLAALGIVLALGAAVAADRPLPRAAAASLLPLLACTLLFTFSRGSWLALASGLGALAVLHPVRIRLAGLALVLAPVPALAVWLAARPDALTTSGATLEAAARDGHRVALVLAGLTALQAGVAVASIPLAARVRVGRRERRALAVVLALLALAASAVVLVRVGTPLDVVDRAADSFSAPLPETDGELERRLFSASGNGRSDYWRVALEQARDAPVLGAGAGGYERRWLLDRPTAFDARDAHNLYLETLAELGPVGLALLLVALGAPLVALARVRREARPVAAGAAYVAFLVHAALDWDWELPAVTVPALVLAGSLLLAARRGSSRPVAPRARALALVVVVAATAFVFVMHAGNTALAAGESALERGDPAGAAADARAARRWLRWSPEPWRLLAGAQVAAGRDEQARASYREAIDRDRENWLLWYGLATASNGAARDHALARARALNPRGAELALLGDEG